MKSARFSALERRLERRFGVSVWIDRAEAEELPSEARPWAVYSRDRNGDAYEIFPCVNPAGENVEPGDWVLAQLERSMFASRLKSSAKSAARHHLMGAHAALDRRVARRKAERLDALNEKMLDGMKHEANVGRPFALGEIGK